MLRKKQLAVLLVAFLFLLVGCDQEKLAATPGRLEFSGVAWNSAPEEVKAALALPEDVELEEGGGTDSDGDWYTILLRNYTCFGLKADEVTFSFRDFTQEGKPVGLSSVTIRYPDGTKLEDVRQALAETYGEPVDRYREARRNLDTQEMEYIDYKRMPTRQDGFRSRQWATI